MSELVARYIVWATRQSRWFHSWRLCCLCSQRKLDLEAERRATVAEKAPNVMLYLELPEGLQGSKISFKRFKANIL
jgi:hypothetical protein